MKDSFKNKWVDFIHELQDVICAKLEAVDGKAKFIEDKWERGENGGGGKTRVMANGAVFEKGGVNTSVVFGDVTDTMRKQLKITGEQWFAAGLSLVIHPANPFVPTVHCNYRYFELYEKGEVVDRWFGGGTDLTPYYLFDEDAKHFHLTYKAVCDGSDKRFYPEFKKTCDDYFVNAHRDNERRGIGGIFYDHKKPDQQYSLEFWMKLANDCGYAFLDAYIPLVEKRKNTAFTEQHKYWQEIRRGRYVEFNLVHDRGTIFGLKTNGRTESILMSLPPTVRFDYNYQPAEGSEEARLLYACKFPRNWVDEDAIDKMDAQEWARRVNTTC